MKVVVVGAGIAGMAAALELEEQGHDVSLVEATDQAGGRGRLLHRPDSKDYVDVGTQYFHSNYQRTFRLLDKLGMTDDKKLIQGKTKFYTDDGGSFLVDPRLPIIKPLGLFGNIKAIFFMLGLVLRYRISVYGLESQPKLDSIAALESTSDPRIQNYIVRCLVLIGALTEPETSNVSLLQLVRLIRIILTTDYVSLKGGTASLHKALAARVKPRLDTPVERLILKDDSCAIGVETAGGERVFADHVVIATDAPAAAKIVPESWKVERYFLESIDMPPCLIISFYLDGPLEKNVWSHFFPLENGGKVSFGVDTMEKNPYSAPSGKTTFQAWILHPHAQPLMKETDAALVDLALTEIETFLPNLKARVEDTAVTKHVRAIPQATVGHNAAAMDFFDSVKQRKGISFCGDYFSGGYLECALWSVERMLNDLKT